MSDLGIPVLNYHAIDDLKKRRTSRNVSVSLTSFREQIRWLHQEGYSAITNEELNGLLWHGRTLSEKRILITFDDGYFSHYKHALDILSTYNFTATLFLSTSFIGKHYEQRDFAFIRHDRQLTWPEIRTLLENGWNIQSHGYTHTRLPSMNIPSVADEIVKSKKIIEQNLGTSVEAFAYPYGIYSKTTIDQLKVAGYTSAYTVHSGKLLPSAPVYQLPRIKIHSADTLDSYKVKVLTGHVSPFHAFRAKIRDIAYTNPSIKDFLEKWLRRLGYSNC